MVSLSPLIIPGIGWIIKILFLFLCKKIWDYTTKKLEEIENATKWRNQMLKEQEKMNNTIEDIIQVQNKIIERLNLL